MCPSSGTRGARFAPGASAARSLRDVEGWQEYFREQGWKIEGDANEEDQISNETEKHKLRA
jgi:hypothetical protein